MSREVAPFGAWYRNARKTAGAVHPFYITAAVALTAIVGSVGYLAWYGHHRILALSSEIGALESQLALATAVLEENIEETHTSLSTALAEEQERVGSIRERLGGFEQQVGSISGTVTTLEKLSRTDPELLQKYSKVFFLNEHYAPERVVLVPDQYEYHEAENNQVHAAIWPYLQTMLNAAKADGVDIYVSSAYRPFEEQRALKGIYTTTYGAGTANTFSADQGYSEHQLGTTVDLITTGIGGTLDGFDTTEAYQWLLQHAHKFGFILSYPEENDYYVFEPWHWRFVGVQLATELHNTNRHFYDLDQRTIDTYLAGIFD